MPTDIHMVVLSAQFLCHWKIRFNRGRTSVKGTISAGISVVSGWHHACSGVCVRCDCDKACAMDGNMYIYIFFLQIVRGYFWQ